MDALNTITAQSEWVRVKLVASELAGISQDALHILFGFLALFAAAAILRRPVQSPLPWLAVLTLEILNEVFDLATGAAAWVGPMWPGSVKDVVTTMSVPTVLLILSRVSPGLFVHRPRTSLRACPEGETHSE